MTDLNTEEPIESTPDTTPAGDNEGDTDEMIPKTRLRGLVKEKAKLEQELAAFKELQEKAKQKAEEAKRKQMERDGDLLGQLELERAEKAKLQQQLEEKNGKISTYQERETARLEALSEDNARRLKALPKALHDLAEDDDPDKMAARLSRAEKIASGDKPISVRSTARGGPPIEPDDALKAAANSLSAAFDKKGA
jgi:DNA repair exonuclease SbcCD ATPase subunit